ncbi:MAG: division/cell wall cluster transcriptional repressor MraZ [SAR324 cluster bacterium]|uniref:Transcriptional regulator MraZ n=1 Tax=SAR324 cluster bacterium TaxID=2024889 RepID=A0A7X9FT21_9DELT|nr:division/cell wall cluster transcriptional repressor MraZ [SAR324 cluster bacterium]
MVPSGRHEKLNKRDFKGAALEPAPCFHGNFTHSLDDKGRVSLPVDFRKTLYDNEEHSVVITNYISEGARCLEGFGIKAWTAFENKLREKSRFSPKLQRLENFYLSRASECPIDQQGRILIPQYLRTYAGIEREMTFTASIHGFRVWDKRVWDLTFAAAEASLMEDPEIFSDIDI